MSSDYGSLENDTLLDIPETIEIRSERKAISWTSITLVVFATALTALVGVSYFTKNAIETTNTINSALSNFDSSSAIKSSKKPNIVLILADDLSFTNIGQTTESIYETVAPRLTALAQSGIIMSNFYGQEVCTPSRSALLTGRYPITNGVQYGLAANM
jgi:hypothetical protein